MIPSDPVILLSYINTKLRDYYDNLEALCEDLGVDEAQLRDKLHKIDYHYDSAGNQFI